MKLIITEKGSLADSVANGLKLLGEKPIKKNGVYQSEKYIIAPAQGHLFELQNLDDYLEKDKNEKLTWYKTYEKLNHQPFIPDKFKFKLKNNETAKSKYATIKKWIEDNRIDTVINCGDADREGEIIVRIILAQAKNKKPVERLWLPDQAPETVADAIKHMKNDGEYDTFANAGYARTYDDWIRGINGTRIATIKANTLIRYGRVKGAIMKIIYDREMEIRNFVPKKYVGISSKEITKGQPVELVSKTTFTPSQKEQAIELAKKYNGSGARVVSIEKKQRKINRPKLFNQSDIQNAMNTMYKIAPKETLQTVQSLYDAGYVTYPRTPSQYMATAEKDKAKNIIKAICKADSTIKLQFRDSKQIFDDSKIESHSGITPTVQIPMLDKLSDIEKKCYLLIRGRFCSVFAEEECIANDTTLNIKCCDEMFKVKGTTYIQQGWKMYDLLAKSNDVIVPNVVEGDEINIDFKPTDKETQPPKRYSVTTLNKYLISPFSKKNQSKNANEVGINESNINDETDDSDDSEEIKSILEGSTIGTEATRAGIIDECIKSGYLKLDKSTYNLTGDGENYINVLKSLNMEPDIHDTVELNKNLTNVLHGTMKIGEIIYKATNDVKKQYDEAEAIKIESANNYGNSNDKNEKKSICTCPKCQKGEIVDNNKAWSCNNCGFAIWKDNALFKKLKKPLNQTLVKKMCATPSRTTITGFTSKTGKKFDAQIELDTSGKYANFKMSFDK